MFEVTEKEATGEVAEIYQDIREMMDMLFVNTIWEEFCDKRRCTPMGMVFAETNL